MTLRSITRLAVRLALSLVLATVSLFPNLPRLAEQLPRALRPERLVDPHFAGSDQAVGLLQGELAALPPDVSFSNRVKAVNTFVRSHIAYASDWDLYGGNLHDWPTPEEVWQRRSDDCDGIAIITASLLQRIGIEATLEYNAFHCWTTAHSESAAVSVGGAVAGPTSSKGDGSMDWLRFGQDLLSLRTWTEGRSFPAWRLILAGLATLSPWLLGPARARRHGNALPDPAQASA